MTPLVRFPQMRLLAASFLALSLAACATPTAYAPLASPGGSGFSETRIDQSHWRVTFRGGSDADSNRVEDLALLRAAQLTLDQGQDWFRVTDRHREGRPPRGPLLSIGVGGASYGRHGGSGWDVGTGVPLGGGAIYSTTLEISLGKGARPDAADAYDARDVQKSIRP